MENKAMKKNVEAASIAPMQKASPIVFDGSMRKTLVEGVVQDIKGYFESKTNGLVKITYEDYSLKNHEFGFRVFAIRGSMCTKQMFSEVSSAMANAVNYMFSGGNEQYDVTIVAESSKMEFEIVSNW